MMRVVRTRRVVAFTLALLMALSSYTQTWAAFSAGDLVQSEGERLQREGATSFHPNQETVNLEPPPPAEPQPQANTPEQIESAVRNFLGDDLFNGMDPVARQNLLNQVAQMGLENAAQLVSSIINIYGADAVRNAIAGNPEVAAQILNIADGVGVDNFTQMLNAFNELFGADFQNTAAENPLDAARAIADFARIGSADELRQIVGIYQTNGLFTAQEILGYIKNETANFLKIFEIALGTDGGLDQYQENLNTATETYGQEAVREAIAKDPVATAEILATNTPNKVKLPDPHDIRAMGDYYARLLNRIANGEYVSPEELNGYVPVWVDDGYGNVRLSLTLHSEGTEGVMGCGGMGTGCTMTVFSDVIAHGVTGIGTDEEGNTILYTENWDGSRTNLIFDKNYQLTTRVDIFYTQSQFTTTTQQQTNINVTDVRTGNVTHYSNDYNPYGAVRINNITDSTGRIIQDFVYSDQINGIFSSDPNISQQAIAALGQRLGKSGAELQAIVDAIRNYNVPGQYGPYLRDNMLVLDRLDGKVASIDENGQRRVTEYRDLITIYQRDSSNRTTAKLMNGIKIDDRGNGTLYQNYETRMSYDAYGRLTTLVENGRITTQRGEQKPVTTEYRNLTSTYTYSSDGKTVTRTVNGQKIIGDETSTYRDYRVTTTYDDNGNPIKTIENGRIDTTDKDGKVTTTEYKGLESSFTYGQDGSQASKTLNGTKIVDGSSYSYDNYKMETTFDSNGNLVRLVESGKVTITDKDGKVTTTEYKGLESSFTYGADGSQASKTLNGTKIVDGSTYSYDNYKMETTFDAEGNLVRLVESGKVTVTDKDGKVTTTEYKGLESSFTYGQDGSQASKTLNGTKIVDGSSYSYDNYKMETTFDAEGNLVRLVESGKVTITDKDGKVTTTEYKGFTTNNTYDSDGKLVSRTLNGEKKVGDDTFVYENYKMTNMRYSDTDPDRLLWYTVDGKVTVNGKTSEYTNKMQVVMSEEERQAWINGESVPEAIIAYLKEMGRQDVLDFYTKNDGTLWTRGVLEWIIWWGLGNQGRGGLAEDGYKLFVDNKDLFSYIAYKAPGFSYEQELEMRRTGILPWDTNRMGPGPTPPLYILTGR